MIIREELLGRKKSDFNDDLTFSNRPKIIEAAYGILLNLFPGAEILKANQGEDINGTDHWVIPKNGQRLSVDIKARRFDRGKNDVALEPWSIKEKNIEGWTRNGNKRTDYILFYWHDTGKFYFESFHILRVAYMKNWREWLEKFYSPEQPNKGWTSQCTFVPIGVLKDAMRNVTEGYL